VFTVLPPARVLIASCTGVYRIASCTGVNCLLHGAGDLSAGDK